MNIIFNEIVFTEHTYLYIAILIVLLLVYGIFKFIKLIKKIKKQKAELHKLVTEYEESLNKRK